MGLPFLDFPAEIREQVYSTILRSANARQDPIDDEEPPFYSFDLNILLVNKQVHREAKKIFQDNKFVKITTPWEEAFKYINGDGQVPMVAKGVPATKFHDYHLLIDIGQSIHHPTWQAECNGYSMLTCLEDLPPFTQMWHHSNLNSIGRLNPHLTLTLRLQDPHVPDRKIPKSLQENLLLPFSTIKNLESFLVTGPKLLPSVEENLSKARAIPDPTIEECVSNSLALKEEGNALLNSKDYTGALAKYVAAHAAIHITVLGRRRIVHCENFYNQQLTSGTFQDQNGDYVRVILRIKLVANVVLTYLRMGENEKAYFEEAYFWGERSILIYRSSMLGHGSSGENRVIGGEGWDPWIEQAAKMRFVPREGMGKIFYRTALAAGELGRFAEEMALFKGARAFLPGDEVVVAKADEADGRARERGRDK